MAGDEMKSKADHLPVILPCPAHALYGAEVYAHIVGNDRWIERPSNVVDGRAGISNSVVFCFHSHIIRGV